MVRATCRILERCLLFTAIFWIGFLTILIKLELENIRIQDKPIIMAEPPQIIYNMNCPPTNIPKINLPKFLTGRYHTIVAGGGLGNHLFELVSMLGIAYSTGRTPLISATDAPLIREITNHIVYKFPFLIEQFTVKIMEVSPLFGVAFHEVECCRYVNVSHLLEYQNNNVLYIDGVYFQSFKYFHALRSEVRKWLTPPWKVMKKASIHLLPNRLNDFVICTHVRRGDFTEDGVHEPSDPIFTRQATEFLVRKHSTDNRSTSVVVLGNDPIWSQAVFKDLLDNKNSSRSSNPYHVIITPTMSPEVDIAFSSRHCDVVLITAPSSTFGWWLAYLAKDGAAVYYRDIGETGDKGRLEDTKRSN